MKKETTTIDLQASGKTVLQLLAASVPVVTAGLELLKDDRSYELIFLAAFCLMMFLFIKSLMDKIDALTASDRLCNKRLLTVSNSMQNMWQDMVYVRGNRQIGTFALHQELGISIYVPVAHRPPDGEEQRDLDP